MGSKGMNIDRETRERENMNERERKKPRRSEMMMPTSVHTAQFMCITNKGDEEEKKQLR